MYIIKDNTTNLVIYIGTEPLSDVDGVWKESSISTGLSVETTTALEVVEQPTHNFLYTYTYSAENGWVIADQDMYNALLAEINSTIKKQRKAAYTVESDPIFFKSQRGEATNQEWLDAIAAIDARFPYQE
jgi:hypothetical protein